MITDAMKSHYVWSAKNKGKRSAYHKVLESILIQRGCSVVHLFIPGEKGKRKKKNVKVIVLLLRGS